MRSFRRVATTALVALCTLAALVIAPQSATAAGPYITQAASVRSCVNTSDAKCAAFATFSAGTPVSMTTWIDGSWATGAYRSNRWFLVKRSDGFEAFVHSSLVGRQTSSPACSTIRCSRLRGLPSPKTARKLCDEHLTPSTRFVAH